MESIVSAAGEISPEEKENILNKKIEMFFEAKSLGTKRALVLHALHVMSIDTVRQLTEASRNEILRGPGMGEKTLQMIEDILASYDLSIKKV
jgi:DNA-directed RNA polymerase alpha subunit